jgi:hypothetical protein
MERLDEEWLDEEWTEKAGRIVLYRMEVGNQTIRVRRQKKEAWRGVESTLSLHLTRKADTEGPVTAYVTFEEDGANLRPPAYSEENKAIYLYLHRRDQFAAFEILKHPCFVTLWVDTETNEVRGELHSSIG